MIFRQRSLFQLSYYADNFITQHQQLFDTLQYSRFKYGSSEDALLYAQAMMEKIFITETAIALCQEPIFVTSSAYKVVPTASDAIANHLVLLLRQAFPMQEFQKIKIYRDIIFESDYGKLNHQERKRLMREMQPVLPKQLCLEHKKVIVIDDIRITGAHEDRLRAMFREQAPNCEIFFVYIATFKHKVPPHIEHILNHAYIDNIQKMHNIIRQPNFVANARFCKFLLSYSDTLALELFLDELPLAKLLHIQDMIKSDSYHLMPSYQANYQLLTHKINRIASKQVDSLVVSL